MALKPARSLAASAPRTSSHRSRHRLKGGPCYERACESRRPIDDMPCIVQMPVPREHASFTHHAGVQLCSRIGRLDMKRCGGNAVFNGPVHRALENISLFQCKMNLQDEPEGKGMLTMDDQRARSGKANSGTDRKVPKGHGGGSIRDQQAGGGFRMGRATTLPAGILAAGAGGSRPTAPLHRENDGAEPRTDYATGGPLFSHRASAHRNEPPASFSAALLLARV